MFLTMSCRTDEDVELTDADDSWPEMAIIAGKILWDAFFTAKVASLPAATQHSQTRGVYTGDGRSTIFRKKADRKIAAAGAAPLSSFFDPASNGVPVNCVNVSLRSLQSSVVNSVHILTKSKFNSEE